MLGNKLLKKKKKTTYNVEWKIFSKDWKKISKIGKMTQW